MDVLPLSPFIAAEVRGLDVSADVSDADIQLVHEAWYAHLVLVFRRQVLTDEQLVRFSRRFGELEKAPIGEAANLTSDGNVPNLPEVNVVSNVIENGVAIGGLGAGEAIWHTDMSYIREPPSASLLYALEVPATGGDTSFINMYEAFDALPDDMQHTVGRYKAKHDASHNSAGNLRKGFQPVTDVSQAPGAIHPMVRTHPETGHKALYLGRRRNAYIVDLPVVESEHTLDAIWQAATQGAHTYTHHWQVGDLLLWDNRCTMHRRDAFDANARRIMHRTQIKGDEPF